MGNSRILFAILTAAEYIRDIHACNPLKNGINVCPPNLASPQHYYVDFSKQTGLPPNWTISNHATVNYGAHGAEFTFAKRFDAPQLWTDFYILFGKVEVVMQAAPGTGIISSSVLMSDDLDEIDWEFSGNNFGDKASQGKVQTNYYGKGITGWYDRGGFSDVGQPQATFHTYTVDWTQEQIVWMIDGQVVRTLKAKDADTNTHQFPQSPCKVQLGLWDGGDADTPAGTVQWAGGYTDLTKAPFTMYVRSVSIVNYSPGAAYNYTDTSGSWQSIKMLPQYQPEAKSMTSSSTVTPSSSSSIPMGTCLPESMSKSSTAAPPAWTVAGTNSACYSWHVVGTGDTCSSIEARYSISDAQLRAWNPGIDRNCWNIMTGIAYCVCGGDDDDDSGSQSSLVMGSSSTVLASDNGIVSADAGGSSKGSSSTRSAVTTITRTVLFASSVMSATAHYESESMPTATEPPSPPGTQPRTEPPGRSEGTHSSSFSLPTITHQGSPTTPVVDDGSASPQQESITELTAGAIRSSASLASSRQGPGGTVDSSIPRLSSSLVSVCQPPPISSAAAAAAAAGGEGIGREGASAVPADGGSLSWTALPRSSQTSIASNQAASIKPAGQRSDSSPSSLRCPAANGTVYRTSCGAEFVIECALDRAGGDMTGNPVYTASLVECLDRCNDKGICVAVSWLPGKPKGPCYLKSTEKRPRPNGIVWGARIRKGCRGGWLSGST